MWYDLGATHSCVYKMRNRLAMGCSAQPRPTSPVARASTSASSVHSHPRVGQKALRIPPESAPAASTTGQSTETPPQPVSAKEKDKRKKKKKVADAASPLRPKRSKKRAASAASSDTEIDDNPVVPKEETSTGTKDVSTKRSKGSTPGEAPPPESSDSQAEGPFTNCSDSEGTESAPESKNVSSSRR